MTLKVTESQLKLRRKFSIFLLLAHLTAAFVSECVVGWKTHNSRLKHQMDVVMFASASPLLGSKDIQFPVPQTAQGTH
jgi:hypothetical protein